MKSAHILLSVLGAAIASSATASATDWNKPAADPAGVVTRMDENGYVARAVTASRTASLVTPPAPTLVPANWHGLGPFGGDIADVAASPQNASIVLAGLAPANGGAGTLFRSTNAGGSWTEVTDLTGQPVYDIEFAPNGDAYVGTLDGVWKSTNAGANWTHENLNIGLNDQVFDVHIDPSNPLRIWCGVADALGNQPVNVMLSIDGGVTWANKTPPLAAPTTCTCIAIDPTNTQKIFCGFGGAFGGGQVWFSPDSGTTWFNRSAGLPNTPVMDIVHDGTRVLVGGGQLFGSQNFGLFASTNDGVTWTPLHNGTWPVLVVQSIAVDPNNANVIFVGTAAQGVFKSIDGGVNWTFGVGGTSALSVLSVRFSPGSSSVIYTGSSSFAVWKSTDGGATFAPSSTGIGALDVFSVAANPLNPNELAICFQGQNNGGVYSSTNAGTTWTPEAVPGVRYNEVKFSPAGVLYAISDGPTGSAPEALYRRTGTTWTNIGPDQGTLFESELYGMVVSANNPGEIIAVGQDFGVAGFEQTIWRTTNGGGMWTKVVEGVANKPFQDVWLVDPAADTTFVATYTDFTGGNAGGLMRSTNGGVAWSPVTNGVPPQFQGYSLSGSSITPGTLYAGNGVFSGGFGVYKSVDSGASWTSTGWAGGAREVLTDASDPLVLYITPVSGTPRVMASTDGGATFNAYDTGLAGAGFARDLQRSATALLLATSTGTYASNLTTGSGFCFGDGSGTACPCGNNSPVGSGAGCLNSFGQGAVLTATGTASVASDSVVLVASGMPASTSALFFQGTSQQGGGTGAVFGDGLRCASGTIVRLKTKTVTNGAAAYPQAGDPSVSVRGQLPAGGGTRHYQTWYRNAAVFCTPSTFNLTNGLTISWTP